MQDLVRYLNEIVDPTVKEFEADRTSVRKAFLTCVAVYHAVDRVERRGGNSKRSWREQSPAFALVDDVAHAFKHVVATKTRNQLRSDEVTPRPPAFLRSGRLRFISL